ncbi:MAG: thioredoxin domain-containing protein [Patescibacteria group bacterium]
MAFYYFKFKWYQKWWGITLLGMSGLLAALVLFFAGLTGYYWWQIKQGNGLARAQQIFAGFDRSVKEGARSSAVISREKLETNDDPFFGNPNAKIVIVAFMDFKCPNSKSAYPIIKKLFAKYGNKIKFIIRDFPGESIHPGATKLAQMASCAQAQGKYWEMSDLFFEQQDQLPIVWIDSDMEKLTGDAGVNYNELGMCLKSGSATVEVNRDYADGFMAGVSGTPTFFVNGTKIEGVVTWDAWEKFMKNYE